jgi:hypothetical protein
MDELKTLRERAQFYEGGEILVDADAILSLLGRLEKAEADAKRYRWLRDCATWDDIEELSSRSITEWDASIDAAAVAQLDKQETRE